jgi:hypothetical protein
MFKVGQLIQSTQMNHLNRLTVLNPSFVYNVHYIATNGKTLEAIVTKILPLDERCDELTRYVGSKFLLVAEHFKLYGAMKPISTIRIK